MSSNLMKVYFYRLAERGKFTQLEKRESESDCHAFASVLSMVWNDDQKLNNMLLI